MLRGLLIAACCAAGLPACGRASAAAAAGTFDPSAPVRGREGASSGGMSEVSPDTVAPAPPPPAEDGAPSAASFLTGGRQLRVGGIVSGRIERTDTVFEDGRRGDEYTFTGTAGDSVSIYLRGGEQAGSPGSHLDVYLYLMHQGREIGRDDDGGGNLDSRLVARLPATGAYTIRACAYSPSAEGEYTLSLRPNGE